MNKITTPFLVSFYKALFLVVGISLVASCKRPEYRKPENKGYGTISFTVPTTTQVNKFDGTSKAFTLYVKNIGTLSDSAYNYVLINADNNLLVEDLRKVQCTLRVRKNHASGDTIVFMGFNYSEGSGDNLPTSVYQLNGGNRVKLVGLALNGDNSQKWFNAFSMQDLNCTAGRSTRTIKGLVIDVSSFGTIDLTTSGNVMAFNCNNLSCGSFKQQTKLPKQLMHPYKQPIQGMLGIDTLTATFDANDNSPFSKITIVFKHLGDALAYGPVGEHDYIDGRGTTNISVTAWHKNGTIYREQKDKGYVYMRHESAWRLRPNTFEFAPGSANVEFEFDLVNSNGKVISVTAGKANYLVKDK
jgi:hypothetical protein